MNYVGPMETLSKSRKFDIADQVSKPTTILPERQTHGDIRANFSIAEVALRRVWWTMVRRAHTEANSIRILEKGMASESV